MKSETIPAPHEKNKVTLRKRLLRSFGIAGFLFFLIKGLIWLAVFFGLGQLFNN